MNAPVWIETGVFAPSELARFASCYPEVPHILGHRLNRHALLELDSLAELSLRLPASSVEYSRGDLPIGIEGHPPTNGLTIDETIRKIAGANSWAALKNIEQDSEYRALLASLFGELRAEIESKTGAMLNPKGSIFISSPGAVTPYHFDPGHNILLQIQGSKVVAQFPAGDTTYAADENHETCHRNGTCKLPWREELMAGATEFHLVQGEAAYIPAMAPHFVRVGPESSISLSISWQSEWSRTEADARRLNHILRAGGFRPCATRRWPAGNRIKAYTYRALRKFGLVN